MPSAITALSNLTLSAAQTAVTFSSISGSYRDLYVVVTAKSTASQAQASIRLNTDTGFNYSGYFLETNGSSLGGSSYSTNGIQTSYSYFNFSNSYPSVVTANIMDYSATDKHKTVLTRASDFYNSVNLHVGKWASTSAVTAVTITSTSTFQAGSTFTLYGVSA